MRSVLFSVALSLVLANWVSAADEVKAEGTCPIEKISKVLASWKTVSEEAKNGCPEELAKAKAEAAAITKICPIGSRMGDTLAFVKSVLGSAIAVDEACAKSCPLAAAKEGAAKEASAPSTTCCEGAKLMEARTKLLTSLSELAGHAVCTSSAFAEKSACCASKETLASAKSGLCESKAGEIVAKIRAETCDKGAAAIVLKEIEGLKCETKAGEIIAAIRAEKCDQGAAQILVKASSEVLAAAKSETVTATGAAAKAAESCAGGDVCCKDLAARATALKASWDKVPAELKDMCPQKKQELMASMGALSQKWKAVALLPETLASIGDGFEALVSINTKMAEWAKANPDALKDVPCESKKAFETQNALIQEANEVLKRIKSATGGGASACTEKKTETASAK